MRMMYYNCFKHIFSPHICPAAIPLTHFIHTAYLNGEGIRGDAALPAKIARPASIYIALVAN
jgi:hypothetical protein